MNIYCEKFLEDKSNLQEITKLNTDRQSRNIREEYSGTIIQSPSVIMHKSQGQTFLNRRIALQLTLAPSSKCLCMCVRVNIENVRRNNLFIIVMISVILCTV